MNFIKPFRGIRLKEDAVNCLESLNHDSINKLDINTSSGKIRVNVKNGKISDCSNLSEMDFNIFIHNDLIKEEKESLYIYSYLDKDRNKEYLGLVGIVPNYHYINGKIKTHELTRDEKILDMVKCLENYNSEAAPVFLTYKDKKDRISIVLKEYSLNNSAIYNFNINGIEKKIWKINDSSKIIEIQKHFDKIKEFYIADGHHRCYAKSKYDKSGNFLSILFSEKQIEILDYNRFVYVDEKFSIDNFLKEISSVFKITTSVEPIDKPKNKNTIVMLYKELWYLLEFNLDIKDCSVEKMLDVNILQDYIFNPFFNIYYPTRDKRLEFYGGEKSYEKLIKKTKEANGIAFFLKSTTKEDFFYIADSNKIMPPKSTWFMPKIASGIIMYNYKEDEKTCKD